MVVRVLFHYSGRVGIVGGGPAGLLVARELLRLGLEVDVFEASKRVGRPAHCTGIVSTQTFERLGVGFDCVEAVYEEAVFVDDGLRVFARVKGSPLAVKLGRPCLEEFLAGQVRELGGRLFLGARVVSVDSSGKLLLEGGRAGVYGYVVVADGATRTISRKLFDCQCSWLVGVEVRVVLQKRVRCNAFYTFHGPRFSKGFFAWFAPVTNGREAVVGVGSRDALLERLELMLQLIDRLVGIAGVRERRSGIILGGPPARKPVVGRVYGIGDALCTSKPFTGGGLYAISMLYQPLAASIRLEQPRTYEKAYRALARELQLQHLYTRAARNAWPLAKKLLELVFKLGCRVDFDKHSSIISCLFKRS